MGKRGNTHFSLSIDRCFAIKIDEINFRWTKQQMDRDGIRVDIHEIILPNLKIGEWINRKFFTQKRIKSWNQPSLSVSSSICLYPSCTSLNPEKNFLSIFPNNFFFKQYKSRTNFWPFWITRRANGKKWIG